MDNNDNDYKNENELNDDLSEEHINHEAIFKETQKDDGYNYNAENIRNDNYNYNNNYHRNDYDYKRRNRSAGLSYLATALIGAIIGGTITAAASPLIYTKIYSSKPGTVNSIPSGQQVVINTSGEMNVASAVAKKVMPTVVGISTITVQSDFFFGSRKSEGVGSGVVVNPNGYILTNSHVVGVDPEKLTVYFMNGLELEGKVLWQDSTLDMAIVKVEAAEIPTAELGDSDKIDVGQTAIAIGNPLGLRFERTVTQGIVSGLNRSIMINESEIMEDLIQTDAAINPGNSGGPLINNQGQIIGINTVKASAEGLGFAIPINIAKPIINQLIEKGVFRPTYLGVSMFDREIAGYYENTVEIKSGVYIMNVGANSPASRAGLKERDIITHIDGVEVNTMLKVKSILYTKKPGDKIKVTFIRDNTTKTAEVTLEERPLQP